MNAIQRKTSDWRLKTRMDDPQIPQIPQIVRTDR